MVSLRWVNIAVASTKCRTTYSGPFDAVILHHCTETLCYPWDFPNDGLSTGALDYAYKQQFGEIRGELEKRAVSNVQQTIRDMSDHDIPRV